MPNVTLAKPRTVAGAIITGTGIGTSYSTDTFVMKVESYRLRFSTPFEDTTGDGDQNTGPIIENSQDLYGVIQLSGFMVGAGVGTAHTLGIINMKDQSTPVQMGIVFSSGEFWPSDGGNDVNVLITEIVVSGSARGPHLGVAITLHTTDSAFFETDAATSLTNRDIGDT